MEEKRRIDLGPLQRTLLLPVWARAVETRRERPLLRDETAVRILESADYDFDAMAKNIGELSRISWIARCVRYDQVIRDFILRHERATVVNIGCGLDTTYERVGAKQVRWYDLDLPEVITLRRSWIGETEKRTFIAGSFTDTRWFDLIDRGGALLFVSAGVFSYFPEEVVRTFLEETVRRFSGVELFFDVTSSHGVKAANEVLKKAGLDAGARMKWALDKTAALLSWDRRIELVNTYHTFRLPGLSLRGKDRLLAAISDILGIQRMLHLRVRGAS